MLFEHALHDCKNYNISKSPRNNLVHCSRHISIGNLLPFIFATIIVIGYLVIITVEVRNRVFKHNFIIVYLRENLYATRTLKIMLIFRNTTSGDYYTIEIISSIRVKNRARRSTLWT